MKYYLNISIKLFDFLKIGNLCIYDAPMGTTSKGVETKLPFLLYISLVCMHSTTFK